jgi:membrane-anchored glycerophosphoryl diester phosphodiesterase (GDPDase)
MESHKKIAGTLFIVFSAFQILGMLVLSFFVTLATRFILDHAGMDEQWVANWLIPLIPLIRALAWGVVLVISLPGLIAGIGLLNQKKWALTLALIVACFKLFSFPFGTGLAIYTFWIYLEDRKLGSPAGPEKVSAA